MPDDPLLTIYLADIARYDALADPEARALAVTRLRGIDARRALDGGEPDASTHAALRREVRLGDRAERRLAQGSLALVVEVAAAYGTPTGPPLLDLVQEGNVGLLRAIDTFSPGGDATFAEHVTAWVRRAIEEGLANDDV